MEGKTEFRKHKFTVTTSMKDKDAITIRSDERTRKIRSLNAQTKTQYFVKHMTFRYSYHIGNDVTRRYFFSERPAETSLFG